MHLTVTRTRKSPTTTTGLMDVDGVFECFTLEPADCIPEGTYPLRMLFSPRFGKPMPHVCDVAGHTEIEIHPGNYAKDTHGCTLVGKSRGTDAVFSSQEAFSGLMAKIADQPDVSISYVSELAASAG